MITRTKFVEQYVETIKKNMPNASARFALIGVAEIAEGWKMVAMPCACGNAGCEGWGMVTPETLDHHLMFDAPQALRDAYREAIAASGGVALPDDSELPTAEDVKGILR